MSESPTNAHEARNPGPGWGYTFLRMADRVLPEWLYRPARAAGTWIALSAMPRQRHASRAYLQIVFNRQPRLIEIFRHFFAFEEILMTKLRVINGRPHRGVLAADAADFKAFIDSNTPALLGTFHFANSDLSGFLFGGQERRRIALVRQRVGNSSDTELLGRRFAQWVSFIWVNEAESLLFAIKDAIATGHSVALKCDRVEFSAKTDTFQFLGAKRIFPVTIYHLAIIFQLPVLLSLGLPSGDDETLIESAPAWRPDPQMDRQGNLTSAHAHFQSFLVRVESHLRSNPYWWFNFQPLNPEVGPC